MTTKRDGTINENAPTLPGALAATLLPVPTPVPSLPNHTAPNTLPQVNTGPNADPQAPENGARYQVQKLLGAGGMGEVHLCLDTHIGREVALKALRLHGDFVEPELLARFLREARVQGQLEHPAVVPVHDLGVLPNGTVFFTMKRVRGIALDAIVRGLREGNPDFVAKYTRRKLLAAFVQVCLAVDFAHTRGVLHRDLKPANIMLGDFGEVHVLDWGIAKVRSTVEIQAETLSTPTPTPLGATVLGSLMGTPGYMAPEQVRGEHDQLDARADVYSLGAILFELLTLHPLHSGDTIDELLVATLHGANAQIHHRFPSLDVPPELEAICSKATAFTSDERFSSARALSDAVERVLEGAQDQERRHALAMECVARAHTAAMRAAMGAVGADAEAMKEVSRALALDPENADARAVLAFLFTATPEEIPADALKALEEKRAIARASAARVTAFRYLSWLAFTPGLIWLGARNGLLGIATFSFIGAAFSLAWWMYRSQRTGDTEALLLLLCSNMGIALLSAAFGPFLLVPSLAATNAMFFALQTDRGNKRRFVIAVALCSLLIPLIAELTGIVPPSYEFANGFLTVHPRLVEFPAFPTLVVLVIAHVALVVTPSVLVGRLRDALERAERQAFLHAWRIQQLVPEEARNPLQNRNVPLSTTQPTEQ